MLEKVLPVVALGLLVAIVPRFRDLRPRANAGRRAMTGVLIALMVSVASAAPSLGARFLDTAAVPHLDLLVGRVAIVIGSCCAMRGFTIAFGSRGIFLPHRIDVTVVVLIVSLLTLMFFAADLPAGGDPLIEHQDEPALTAFVLAWSAYLGWCCAGIVAGWRTWKTRAVGPGRTGLRLTTIAGVTGFTYALGRCLGEAFLLTGAGRAAVEFTRQLCLAAGSVTALFIMAGACWAPVSGWFRWVVADGVRRIRLQQLHSLWRDVAEAVPGISLEGVSSRVDDLTARDSRWLLYRRVIEILDGQAELREAAALDGDATRVLRAIESSFADDPQSHHDVDAEARRLARVARRYRQTRRLAGSS